MENRRQLAMKNNILLKTNLLVSVILLVGFALIATLSYRANYNASLVKIKQVSSLASERYLLPFVDDADQAGEYLADDSA